jgi:hypothetical protein
MQKDSLKKLQEINQQQRFDFIDYWVKYMQTHSDKEWSRQQNTVINSQLKTANMDRVSYLKMKGDKFVE